jgi:hypothetical protein
MRVHTMVATLIGCPFRWAELLALYLESIQQREEHQILADLVRKAGHVGPVSIPTWVRGAVDAWTAAGGIKRGAVLRAISTAARLGRRHVAQGAVGCRVAARADIDKSAPDDLRRTCARARLCHLAGGELITSSSCSATS